MLLEMPIRTVAQECSIVTGVRISDHNGTTRFVMDLSSATTFNIIKQNNPLHVIIEFPNLNWPTNINKLQRPIGILRDYYHKSLQLGTKRLTLKAICPVSVKKIFLLSPNIWTNYRLVIDLKPVGSFQSKSLNHKNTDFKKPIVVIDPGHGGIDPGAISISGVNEKNIVLSLAHIIKAHLDKSGLVKCVLTRDRDVFIPLRKRIEIGREANADLFISLHVDTVANPKIRGLSVYTLSQKASDKETQHLADKENKSDIVSGIDLSNESSEVTNVLIDLIQRESLNLSSIFAHQLIKEVSNETHQLLQNTHRFAGFAVLKTPDIPSVLIETGYLSNADEEQMLIRKEYRVKLAIAMKRAIEHYFAQTKN
ncbi:MAG: N-acetylmuramoyl-L-alanine amidase [Rhodospirillaceae bacterium]|jgi:N-acetylmuramoyl-L-alanine amidase|nr:N-acetylmuramoyl-L-alanine amidase [Rhodospirillaceae bacterium]